MLNRKYADLRQSPQLDPRPVRYDAAALPQSIVRLGPACRRKVKGGAVLALPGYTWSLFFFPGEWYTLTSVHDLGGHLVAHHVDLATPCEEKGCILSFLDLKLDLLIPARGPVVWLDRDEYEEEVEAGTISKDWQRRVAEAVEAIDRAHAALRFPPAAVTAFEPPTA